MVAALAPRSQDVLDRVSAAIATVCDPEIPVLTLNDLGVVRHVALTADGQVEVTITPTYSGCPAMSAMALDLQAALAAHGFADARIRTVLSPPWTTDWMTEEGRGKLLAYGIAPPPKGAGRRSLFADDDSLACPHCASRNTRKLSEFGSTACKALWRCDTCLEPFDAFKCL